MDHARTRAFTLVELLVVIGVIALLISILMPALTAARQSALSLQCLSNLRQMATAAHAYAVAHKGYLPPANLGGNDGANAYAYGWDYTLVTDLTTFQVTIRPGLLWEGRADLKIQQCPVFEGPAMAAHNPYTGYNYNTSYIGRGLYSAGSKFDPPARLAQVRKPAETALFGDGEFASGANKYMRSPAYSGFPSDNISGRSSGTQGFRHRGKTNVAFCDGHAESLSERFGTGVAAGTGFLSADNSLYDLE